MHDRILIILYFIFLSIETGIRLHFSRAYRRSDFARDGYRGPWDTALLALSSVGMFFLPALYAFTPLVAFADYALPRWVGAIGVVIFVASAWLLQRAHRDLGRNWSWTLEAHYHQQLVTDRTYRFIRHPIYLAHLLWGFAQPFLIHNWLAGFSMLVTILPLLAYRIPREERMMMALFGDEYARYMAVTHRFLPIKGLLKRSLTAANLPELPAD